MLKTKNLTVKIQDKTIFSDINLELKSSDILIVTGNNGSGKTTFLNSIAGLIEPSSGEILCAGFNIADYFEDYIHDYSYIASENVLCEDFTVKYYLNFWAKFNNTKMLLESTISYFQMQPILYYQVSKLSSGWQKRLYFAKLIMDNKLIWLLDEPLAFLDLNGKDLIINMINSRLLSGGLVILTTNQPVNHFKAARYFSIETCTESKIDTVKT